MKNLPTKKSLEPVGFTGKLIPISLKCFQNTDKETTRLSSEANTALTPKQGKDLPRTLEINDPGED